MLEGAVMEYAKWFITILSLMFIAVAVVFMFRLNELNTFQQEVNYQIERNGGLTAEAKSALNEIAKDAYGGCLVVSTDDNAECLNASDKGTKSSGFFVREYIVNDDGTKEYYDRPDGEAARYGTQVRYVITRQLGNIGGVSFLKPSVVGTSASRVRGTSD